MLIFVLQNFGESSWRIVLAILTKLFEYVHWDRTIILEKIEGFVPNRDFQDSPGPVALLGSVSLGALIKTRMSFPCPPEKPLGRASLSIL
jgi:hypothetical protein